MDALLEQRIQYLERLLSTKTRSPIVVQLASLYLEAGRPHDALRYCDNAIAHFPYYTTAHLMRARVLSALEMKAEARREFEFVHSVLPDVVSVRARLDEIPASEAETFQEHNIHSETEQPVEDQVIEEKRPTEDTDEIAEPAADEVPLESSADEASPSSGFEGASDESVSENPEAEQPGGEPETAPTGTDEDPFGLGTTPDIAVGIEEPVASTEEATDLPAVNSFDDLGPSGAESSFTPDSSMETTETFEEFAEAKRSELAGNEGTLGIEEFLEAGAGENAIEEKNVDEIGELAEKLQSAPKITPIIDITEKKTPPPSEEDTPASTGFVTPTLAEIYAKQGWYDDAIVAYKTLARIKPAERERFERRIKELEELKKSEEQGG